MYLPPLQRRGCCCSWGNRYIKKTTKKEPLGNHWTLIRFTLMQLICQPGRWIVSLCCFLWYHQLFLQGSDPLEKTSIYLSAAEVWVSSFSTSSKYFTKKPCTHSLVTLWVVEQQENIIVCINPLSQMSTDFFFNILYVKDEGSGQPPHLMHQIDAIRLSFSDRLVNGTINPLNLKHPA